MPVDRLMKDGEIRAGDVAEGRGYGFLVGGRGGGGGVGGGGGAAEVEGVFSRVRVWEWEAEERGFGAGEWGGEDF